MGGTLRTAMSWKGLRAAVFCLVAALYPALAVAQATSPVDCHGRTTIADRDHLTQFTCTTYTGYVKIQNLHPPSATASTNAETLPFALNVQDIQGSLEITDIGRPGDGNWSFSANSLRTVTGSLIFSNLYHCEVPSFPALVGSNSIDFSDISFTSTTLESLNDPNAPLWEYYKSTSSITFVNTNIVGIEPFTLDPKDEPLRITVKGNKDLRRFALNGLSSRLASIVVQDNSHGDLSLYFDDLESASLVMNSVANFSAKSLTSLSNAGVEEEAQTISNNSFQSLSLPALTGVNGMLQINNNANLLNLSLPMLQNVDSLTIEGNDMLRYIEMPSLTGINGTLTIRAPLEQLDLNALSGFSGKLDVVLSGGLSCNSVDSLNLAPGQYSCRKGPSSPSSTGTSGSGTASTGSTGVSADSGLSTGAKIGIGVGVGVGVALLLAGVFFLWFRNHQSKKRQPGSATTAAYPSWERKSAERSPVRYVKVPGINGSIHEERKSDDRESPSSGLGDNWSPPEQPVPTTEGRMELEEQQRPRHEMDARSLPDMDLDNKEEETRSLQDTERAHSRSGLGTD